MYKKFINLSRRNFNQFMGISTINLLSFNIFFFKGTFKSSNYINRPKLKWILSKKDK